MSEQQQDQQALNLKRAVIDARVSISESEEVVPLGRFTIDEHFYMYIECAGDGSEISDEELYTVAI